MGMEGKVKVPLYTTLSEAVLQKLVLKPERQDLEPGSMRKTKTS